MNCPKCSYAIKSDSDENVEYNLLPCLDISSSIASVPLRTNSDVDLHIPSGSNFHYYNTHEFHSNHDINEYFNENYISLLNCNIRSLSATFDNLVNMLSQLYFSFSIIGLTETKIKVDHGILLNHDLHGYYFVSQNSNTNAGGVGFYINGN